MNSTTIGFFADLYNKFFSPEELSLIQNGREIYMNAEEIKQRLDKRAEILKNEEFEQEQKLQEPSVEQVPVKPRKKKPQQEVQDQQEQ